MCESSSPVGGGECQFDSVLEKIFDAGEAVDGKACPALDARGARNELIRQGFVSPL